MPEFKKKLRSDGTYHAPGKGDEYELTPYSDDQISEWANDEACVERDKCGKELARRAKIRTDREALAESRRIAEEERLTKKRALLEANPFDPRTEVSADARHIAGRIVTVALDHLRPCPGRTGDTLRDSEMRNELYDSQLWFALGSEPGELG